MARLLGLLIALAACAPVPEPAERRLAASGIRPGIASTENLDAVSPPVGTTLRYSVTTPLRARPSEMTVRLERDGDAYRRTETVRIPERSAAEAQLVATMVRQRDGRTAEVVGTDVVLRAVDRADHRGRTRASDLGGVTLAYEPHDCHATPGLCRTVRVNGDGSREPLVVRTTELGGIWREEVRRDPGSDPAGRDELLRESLYSLDENAMLVDMNRLDHEKVLGNYQEIRRVE